MPLRATVGAGVRLTTLVCGIVSGTGIDPEAAAATVGKV